MSRRINLFLTVTINDGADPEATAEGVFNFLAADPDDLFPQIEEVEDYDYVEVDRD
jgi:hypothetical protein